MFTADKLKAVVAVLILAVGIGAFYYLGDKAEWIRWLTFLVIAGISVAVAAQTQAGQTGWAFVQGSRMELRKVVWPTRKETVQTTLVVVAMVVSIAVFLWIIDWGLIKLVQALTGGRS